MSNDDKNAEGSLEEVLRLLDTHGLDEETQRRALAAWIRSHPPASTKTLLVVADAMALYLSDDYKGKVSAAAHKILANGPELTARAREFFLRMASEIRSQMGQP
jgi:hypothetical protein